MNFQKWELFSGSPGSMQFVYINGIIHYYFVLFIFTYLGTVAPSVHENCFSGGHGKRWIHNLTNMLVSMPNFKCSMLQEQNKLFFPPLGEISPPSVKVKLRFSAPSAGIAEIEQAYRKSSIKPPGGLSNFGPSRGGGLIERGTY